jgi:hypothetical protein
VKLSTELMGGKVKEEPKVVPKSWETKKKAKKAQKPKKKKSMHDQIWSGVKKAQKKMAADKKAKKASKLHSLIWSGHIDKHANINKKPIWNPMSFDKPKKHAEDVNKPSWASWMPL